MAKAFFYFQGKEGGGCGGGGVSGCGFSNPPPRPHPIKHPTAESGPLSCEDTPCSILAVAYGSDY